MALLSLEEITQAVDSGAAIVVDVREDYEYQLEHAEGAMLFSVQRILAGQLPTTDTNKTIYLYCATGSRSSFAARALQNRGFTTVDLGGLYNWKRLGGTTIRR